MAARLTSPRVEHADPLIIFLEVVSNNAVEPLLYGTSTGLSTLALIASAMFWTAIWGPIGLVLSTPITVCLLVVGRTPVLGPPMRLYQRLISGAPEAAERDKWAPVTRRFAGSL